MFPIGQDASPAGSSEGEVFPGFERAGEFVHLFVRSLGHRAELAALELIDARNTSLCAAALLAGAACLTMLAAGALTTLVVAAVWETAWRLPVLGIFVLLYAGGAAACALAARKKLGGLQPFSATTEQLRKDVTCLEEILHHR